MSGSEDSLLEVKKVYDGDAVLNDLACLAPHY